MGTFNQHEFDIRLEWGLKGVEILAPISDVIIIVDVLSFSTCVDVATGMGATVYPIVGKMVPPDTMLTKLEQHLRVTAANRKAVFHYRPRLFLTRFFHQN